MFKLRKRERVRGRERVKRGEEGARGSKKKLLKGDNNVGIEL